MGGWDRVVLEAIAEHRTGWASSVTRVLWIVGMSPLAYAAAALLCVLFGWLFRAWRAAVAAPVAAMVAVVVADAAKDLIGRPRPPSGLAMVTAGSFAFPSSIGAMTAAAATPVILAGLHMANRTGRALAWLLLLGTAAIGVAMVYLGAHWLSDVLVGWALGALIGVAVFRLIAGPVRTRAPV